jgi:hypothetical protein
MKLLRPLHRQRTRRRSTARVLDEHELAAELAIPLQDLEANLISQGIAYHKDSRGRIWASVTR